MKLGSLDVQPEVKRLPTQQGICSLIMPLWPLLYAAPPGRRCALFSNNLIDI